MNSKLKVLQKASLLNFTLLLTYRSLTNKIKGILDKSQNNNSYTLISISLYGSFVPIDFYP